MKKLTVTEDNVLRVAKKMGLFRMTDFAGRSERETERLRKAVWSLFEKGALEKFGTQYRVRNDA